MEWRTSDWRRGVELQAELLAIPASTQAIIECAELDGSKRPEMAARLSFLDGRVWL
jgi:hypothetical protein